MKQAMFSIYKFGTRLGVHILPTHYYSPLPDIIKLEKTQRIWAKKSTLPGVKADLDEQTKNLMNICMPHQPEYDGNETYRYAVDQAFGPGYGYIEAQALYAVLRYYKPKRIIEVGSGVSTWCMLNALKTNKKEHNSDCQITCIDPYPSIKIKSIPEIDLIEKQVQTVSFDDAFSALAANDLLFIDSSHTVKPGSDVNHLILEILPKLNAGVVVHFHDIFHNFEYPLEWIKQGRAWNESYLLRAFLQYNDAFHILLFNAYLGMYESQWMNQHMPLFMKNPGGSIWLEVHKS